MDGEAELTKEKVKLFGSKNPFYKKKHNQETIKILKEKANLRWSRKEERDKYKILMKEVMNRKQVKKLVKEKTQIAMNNSKTKKLLSKARKNKTYEEVMGIDEAKRQRELRRIKFTGELNVAKRPEVRKKLRLLKIRYVKEVCGTISPFIGKNEKQVLDNLEKDLKFKILRQYFIEGYFLDGYVPELNLAIEVDEGHHFSNNVLKEYDKLRQSEIERSLNCNFLRFKDCGVNYGK